MNYFLYNYLIMCILSKIITTFIFINVRNKIF